MNNMVSIIIPVYNVEKYLSRCIDSIIMQKYQNWETILIDDGSTDNSGIICDEYEKKDRRIRVIHQKNQGVSMARNAGIDIAKEALKTKDYKTAIEYYSKVCELAPDNSDYLMELAYAYRESQDTEKANEIYRRIMSDFPETQNALDAAEYITE